MKTRIFLFFLIYGTCYICGGQTVRDVPRIELIPGSPDAMIGQTETIRCLFRGGSPPVTYTLFHNMSTREKATVSEGGGATFSITIYNHTTLGPYKCKANNSITRGIYSKKFSFTLREPTSPWLILWMRLLIFLILLVLTIVIMLALLRTGLWKP
ncbi:allergin-1-like [Mantella aurantiaca]